MGFIRKPRIEVNRDAEAEQQPSAPEPTTAPTAAERVTDLQTRIEALHVKRLSRFERQREIEQSIAALAETGDTAALGQESAAISAEVRGYDIRLRELEVELHEAQRATKPDIYREQYIKPLGELAQRIDAAKAPDSELSRAKAAYDKAYAEDAATRNSFNQLQHEAIEYRLSSIREAQDIADKQWLGAQFKAIEAETPDINRTVLSADRHGTFAAYGMFTPEYNAAVDGVKP